jgi:hypothetical protein
MQSSGDAAGALIGGMFGLLWLGFAALGCVALVFWIYALVDAVKRDFPGENEKLIWVLIVVLAGWIGALIYWFVGRPKGTLRA